MTDSRKEELIRTFIENDNNQYLNELTVQEIIFVYFNINNKWKETDGSDYELEKKRTEIFQAILIKMTSVETLYVAYNIATRCPHIDEEGSAWIFSEESFASEAKEHYMSRFIALDIKKISKDEYIEEFCEFVRSGIKTILVDNGHYNTRVHVSDLMITDTSDGVIEQENPGLKFAMTCFFQNCFTKFTFEHKQEFLKELEGNMMREIASAKLLVPVRMKNREHVNDGQTVEINTSEPVEIPTLTNEKEKLNFMPAFTDWAEFVKVYSKDEWNAVIMDYTQFVKASANCDGVMINPAGMPLRISEENVKRIEEFLKK
ncbi:MAG: SseB family protein [Oscillospiraceae bacterium]|nr:SseB family protein [Oscillospiraceae bacterium]